MICISQVLKKGYCVDCGTLVDKEDIANWSGHPTKHLCFECTRGEPPSSKQEKKVEEGILSCKQCGLAKKVDQFSKTQLRKKSNKCFECTGGEPPSSKQEKKVEEGILSCNQCGLAKKVDQFSTTQRKKKSSKCRSCVDGKSAAESPVGVKIPGFAGGAIRSLAPGWFATFLPESRRGKERNRKLSVLIN
jgi:transcription elongation factor Elf1